MRRWAVPGFVHVRQVRIDAVGRRVVARHQVSRKVVSITYLSPEFLADTEFRNRFAIEAERLGQVRQATVARIHRYVECGAGAAVVADHIAGTPLRSVLLEEGAIGAEPAAVIFKDVLLGMAAGHPAGLVHGDVKPEDVVLTPAGRVRLVDFGLSTCAGRQLLARSTPFYLAPEQWTGSPATEAGDLYAATVTFFECLVGAPPFHADNAAALATLHERGTPPLDAVPGLVRDLVRSGLAKNPADRPATRGLLADLQQAAVRGFGPGWERRGRRELSRLVTQPSHPADVPVVPVPARHRHRHRGVRLGAVLGGALVLAAGLSSPPLPGVLLPGSGGLSDPQDRPPVQAFPRIPDNAGVSAGAPPAAHRPPGHQSAATAEPVPTTGTHPRVHLPSTRAAQPRIGSAAAEPAPAPGLAGPSAAGAVPPAPRTTPPVPQPPASAPAPVLPPAPTDQPPSEPVPPGPGEQDPGSSGDEPAPSEQDPSGDPGPAEQDPSAPSEQSPSEPSGQGRSAPPEQRPQPSADDAALSEPQLSEPQLSVAAPSDDAGPEQEPETGRSASARCPAPHAGQSVGDPNVSGAARATKPAARSHR